MLFQTWLDISGKRIDMTGDAWQIHELVKEYVDHEMQATLDALDDNDFIDREMKSIYGYDLLMLNSIKD